MKIKASEVAAANPDTVFSASLFTGWVTGMEFVADVGRHGVLAGNENNGMGRNTLSHASLCRDA